MTDPAGWTITWRDRSWSDADVVGGDMATVQLLIGDGWINQNPWTGPVQLMAWITALELRHGRDLAEVQAELAGAPAEVLLAAIAPRLAPPDADLPAAPPAPSPAPSAGAERLTAA